MTDTPDTPDTPDTIQIKNRWSGALVFECSASADLAGAPDGLRLGFAVKAALAAKANLSGAVLSGAFLSGADLRDADLRDALLSGANLSGADLRGADLIRADLREAVLSGANLRGADLRAAVLSGADLRDAVLSGADLSGADLKSWSETKARRLAAGPDLRDALAAVVALLPDSTDAAIAAARTLLEQVP